MTEFTSKSGAKIVIHPASFEVAKGLWHAIEKAAAQNNINIQAEIINTILAIDSSPEFNNAVWPCLIRCTRDDQKIEKKTFEDVEVRKEYYEIVVACVEINVRPFADSLFSEFSAKLALLTKKQPEENQKS